VRPFASFLNASGVLTSFFFFGRSADGEADAAEIDKELISARLKEDVLDHAGKLHLFVADSVSVPVVYDICVRAAPHPHVVRCFTTSTYTPDTRPPIFRHLCRCLQ
jgi:hypothetical protein